MSFRSWKIFPIQQSTCISYAKQLRRKKTHQPDVHHMNEYLHKQYSDCRAQMRVLSTKRKPFSWIYVSPVLAQPDTNSSETLSDGERKPAANASRQDRSLSAKCSELQLATEDLTVPGVKTGQEHSSHLQCHSSDLTHLSQLSPILHLKQKDASWMDQTGHRHAPWHVLLLFMEIAPGLDNTQVPWWHSSNELQDHMPGTWQQPETAFLGTKHLFLNLYHL